MRVPTLPTLMADWRRWAAAAGEEPGSQKRFSQALEGKGYCKTRTTIGRQAFKGIALDNVSQPYTETADERHSGWHEGC